jgi:DNA-binding MarR family transcriptional regulator
MTTDLAPGPVAALDAPEMAAWRAYLFTHARLARRLDDELQAAHGLSLAEYDALVQLVNAPTRQLRMSTLAESVLLSRSGITRLVDRLVSAGFVERRVCPTDARGAEATLTTTGLDALRTATRTHVAGVRRYFTDVIAAADQVVIATALEGVNSALGHAEPLASATCAKPSA